VRVGRNPDQRLRLHFVLQKHQRDERLSRRIPKVSVVRPGADRLEHFVGSLHRRLDEIVPDGFHHVVFLCEEPVPAFRGRDGASAGATPHQGAGDGRR
jgi:hypothetical protein